MAYQPVKYSPKVSHLLFVDDSLVFSQATTEKIMNILQVLYCYEKAYGHKK